MVMSNKATMSYLAAYEHANNEMKRFKDKAMEGIVGLIKVKGDKPIYIGNMIYYHMMHNGKEVPCYCYRCNYTSPKDFRPIYDEDNTLEFGWHDFEECCRIFDVIHKELTKK